MKAQSTETSKMFFVIPRAVQSLSRYPLISCHFPKPNIKFPPWSESNKSPRRELAVLMKKPEVKNRSGHLSPLPVLAPRTARWAWAVLRRPLALFPRLGDCAVFWCSGYCCWCCGVYFICFSVLVLPSQEQVWVFQFACYFIPQNHFDVSQ